MFVTLSEVEMRLYSLQMAFDSATNDRVLFVLKILIFQYFILI
jgi:hypothetical protein